MRQLILTIRKIANANGRNTGTGKNSQINLIVIW
jgi:hypothetical protein